jgi:hypothetical protein
MSSGNRIDGSRRKPRVPNFRSISVVFILNPVAAARYAG